MNSSLKVFLSVSCALSLLLAVLAGLELEDEGNSSFVDTSDIFTNEAIIDKFNLGENYGYEKDQLLSEEFGVGSDSEIKNVVDSNEVIENLEGSDSDTEIKSSFQEAQTETQLEKHQAIISEVVSQNSGLLNEYSDTGQVLLTIVDTVNAELKNTAEQQAQSDIPYEEKLNKNNTPLTSHIPLIPIKHSTSNLSENNIFSENIPKNVTLNEEETPPGIIIDDTEHLPGSVEQIVVKVEPKEKGEDIPSFAEWAQKQLEEAEKKKEILNVSFQGTQNNRNGRQPSSVKVRTKNYASPDCGAKIVAANAESTAPSSVISPSKDEYMLNACSTSKIWFIVELCEAVQVKRAELANFELFSSTPKDFTIMVSDRFPTRDWNIVGQFTAKDERDIQLYDLHPPIFGKYVKVELHSHYGSEHFCPISLFRLYGISEYEVLETEEEALNDDIDDDDEFVDETLKNEEPSNLFGSAREVVMSFVKKAAQVLVITTSDSSNRTSQRAVDCNLAKLTITEKCQTPSHLIVCDNCSDLFFTNVFSLLSCRNNFLRHISESDYISSAITRTDICVKYGLNFNSRGAYTPSRNPGDVVSAFFGPEYVAAMCNMFAIREKKVVLNTSNSVYTNVTDLEEIVPQIAVVPKVENATDTSVINEMLDTQSDAETILIQPTKTLKDNEVVTKEFEVEGSEPLTTFETEVETKTSELTEISKDSSTVLISITTTVTDPMVEIQDSSVELEKNENGDNFEIVPELDSLLSEWEQLPNNNQINHVTTTPVTPPSTMPQGKKESAFVRLFNRIKALERNMSLSSQYLEELSRRYKKQMEEMQRAFDQTLAAVNEESRKSEEMHKLYVDSQQHIGVQLASLVTAVDTLMTERNSWSNAASWFMHFFIIQLFIAAIIIYFWGKTETKLSSNDQCNEDLESEAIIIPKRRKSLDIIRHESPAKRRRRRPSEEALNITGTYNDLLIPDITELDGQPWIPSKSDKRRKRKKNTLRRSNSNSDLHKLKPIPVMKKYSDSGQTRVNLDLRESNFTVPPKPIEIPKTSPISVVYPTASSSNYVPNVDSPKLLNPTFMKTAVSERVKRLSVTENKSYVSNNGVSRSNSIITSSSLESSQSSSVPEKKDKKRVTGGLKKILKKVF